MKHLTKVNGTDYAIINGLANINGAGYEITEGVTKIDGTDFPIYMYKHYTHLFEDNSHRITTEFDGAGLHGGATVKIGDLFKISTTATLVDTIHPSDVWVTVSPATANDTISAIYIPSTTSDWADGTLTFSADSVGTAKVVISHYLCSPAEIEVNVIRGKHVLYLEANPDNSGITYTVATSDFIQFVDDPISSTGKALRLNTNALSEDGRVKWILTDTNGSNPYFSIHDSRSNANWLTRYVYLGDLQKANNGSYYVKKFANVVVSSTAKSLYAFNDYIQYHSWSKMAGHTVDLYISFRVDGDLTTNPVYYCDHIVAVSKCQLSDDAIIISEATCTEPEISSSLCANCGQSVVEKTAPALGHNFSGERTFDPTGSSYGTYSTVCTREGCGYTYTYGLVASMPAEILQDYPGISGEYVYDFAAFNGFRNTGIGNYAVYDNDSVFKKAYVFDPWADGEFKFTNQDGVSRYDHDIYSTAARGALNFYPGNAFVVGKYLDQITNTQMMKNANQGYKTYKMTWKIPEGGIGPYITGVFDWNFQFYGKDQKAKTILDALAGQTVDVYVRLKVEGNVNDISTPNGHKYYFDRFTFVAQCQNHHPTENWTTIENATCTSGTIQQTICSTCGGTKTRELTDALGHSYVYNATTHQAVCSRCGTVAKTFGAALPQSLLDYLEADGITVDKVTDLQATKYMSPTYNTMGSSGDNTGQNGNNLAPWQVVSDPDSAYGVAYRAAAVDYTTNPGILILKTWFKKFSASLAGSGVPTIEFPEDHQDAVIANSIQDGTKGYFLYKFTGTYPTNYYQYFDCMNGTLRSYRLWNESVSFRGHNVDIYLSVKVWGEASNSGSADKYPIWYVDRLIVVDRGLSG